MNVANEHNRRSTSAATYVALATVPLTLISRLLVGWGVLRLPSDVGWPTQVAISIAPLVVAILILASMLVMRYFVKREYSFTRYWPLTAIIMCGLLVWGQIVGIVMPLLPVGPVELN